LVAPTLAKRKASAKPHTVRFEDEAASAAGHLGNQSQLEAIHSESNKSSSIQPSNLSN
jgi:hypothetical protein